MKVVTLKVPVSQRVFSCATSAVKDDFARSEEEYLSQLAMKGIFSSFFETDELFLCMEEYLNDAVKSIYDKELAGETRQDTKGRRGRK